MSSTPSSSSCSAASRACWERSQAPSFSGSFPGAIAFWQNDTIAKALVLIAIVVLIRFRPQGLFVTRVRT